MVHVLQLAVVEESGQILFWIWSLGFRVFLTQSQIQFRSSKQSRATSSPRTCSFNRVKLFLVLPSPEQQPAVIMHTPPRKATIVENPGIGRLRLKLAKTTFRV